MNEQPSEMDSSLRRPVVAQNVSDCRLVDEVVEEYALGILDPSRQVALDRHLIRCTSCAALVASYLQTAAVLALAVPLTQPPASARTALMTRVAATPQSLASPGYAYAGSMDILRTPTLPASGPLAAPLPPVQPRTQSPWWRLYAAPLATLPLLLALGLVAAWGMNNYAQLNDSQNALAARDMEIARLSSRLSNDNSQGVAEVASSASSKRYTLSPEATGSDAQGTLIADPQSEQAVLRVTGLSSGTYAIVVQMQDGQTVSKGEFDVDAGGTATALLDLGGQVSDLESVHIRPTTSVTETDVAAIEAQADVLMTVIGPDLFQNSDTSPQSP